MNYSFFFIVGVKGRISLKFKIKFCLKIGTSNKLFCSYFSFLFCVGITENGPSSFNPTDGSADNLSKENKQKLGTVKVVFVSLKLSVLIAVTRLLKLSFNSAWEANKDGK